MPLSPDTVLRNIGRRIAELRNERGLTQQEAADQLGITSRYVQAVEAGGVNLSVRALIEWANLLRAPLTAILEAPRSSGPRRPGRPRKISSATSRRR